MQRDTELIVDAMRKASRLLQRDYFELENLQSSAGSNTFCQNSCRKAFETLYESLSKYYKTIIYNSDGLNKADFTGQAILLDTLEGFVNFERSLPYFATIVTVISKVNNNIKADKAIMNFPALGEIYYVEKGKGAWLEKLTSSFASASRSRVSEVSSNEKAVVSIDSDLSKASYFNNIRMFDSPAYSLAQFIRGKIDTIIIKNPSIMSLPYMELFAIESGGVYGPIKDGIILSNSKLYNKIIERIEK